MQAVEMEQSGQVKWSPVQAKQSGLYIDIHTSNPTVQFINGPWVPQENINILT